MRELVIVSPETVIGTERGGKSDAGAHSCRAISKPNFPVTGLALDAGNPRYEQLIVSNPLGLGLLTSERNHNLIQSRSVHESMSPREVSVNLHSRKVSSDVITSHFTLSSILNVGSGLFFGCRHPSDSLSQHRRQLGFEMIK